MVTYDILTVITRVIVMEYYSKVLPSYSSPLSNHHDDTIRQSSSFSLFLMIPIIIKVRVILAALIVKIRNSDCQLKLRDLSMSIIGSLLSMDFSTVYFCPLLQYFFFFKGVSIIFLTLSPLYLYLRRPELHPVDKGRFPEGPGFEDPRHVPLHGRGGRRK